MSVAAHSNRTVKIDGTSTAFTNEATTKVTANTVYQITDANKRVIDPGVAVTVEVDADGGGAGGYAVADPTTYTVDYLYGKVTFDADQGADALVRISGNYLPLLTVAECKDLAYSVQRATLDKTNYDSGGYVEREPGLLNVSGSLRTNKLPEYDHDPGAGTHTLQGRFLTRVLVEDYEATSGKSFRAWVYFDEIAAEGSMSDLLETGVNFTGAARTGTGQAESAAFGWGS